LAVKPIAGIDEVIKYLKERGLTIGILSSSDSKIIKKFIRKNNLDVFDFIRSKRNLFGKAPEIKKILKMYNLSPGQAFYVGDEVRDIEAAKVAGVFSVAVNWGFNSKKALQKADPDYFIDAVSDLKKILNQLDF
jgi:phosphoglycolate phosphatase